MKKWLRRIGLVVLLIIGTLFVIAAWSETDTAVVKRYESSIEPNPVIKPDWPGTPVDQKGRFMNHEFPFLPRGLDLIKWKAGGNSLKEEKERDTARLEVKDPREFLASDRDGIIWLGHASFYIRLGGYTFLTDPVFGDPPTFLRRFVPVESPLQHIKKLDYVLLSHDHRDHMDEPTLRAINAKFPRATFLAGLRTDELLFDWMPSSSVKTAAWFESFDGLGSSTMNIFFVPVRHWSRRGLFDTNWRLWGGYVIQTPETTIYFGGDSGYGRHYKEVGELLPKIDYFLIGIGAYEPRWFMEPNHNNPSDAMKAFIDSGARNLIPMHYGTFDLSDEPPSQPLQQLQKEAEKHGVADKVKPLAINDSISF